MNECSYMLLSIVFIIINNIKIWHINIKLCAQIFNPIFHIIQVALLLLVINVLCRFPLCYMKSHHCRETF
jgi:hypothetical protein